MATEVEQDEWNTLISKTKYDQSKQQQQN